MKTNSSTISTKVRLHRMCISKFTPYVIVQVIFHLLIIYTEKVWREQKQTRIKEENTIVIAEYQCEWWLKINREKRENEPRISALGEKKTFWNGDNSKNCLEIEKGHIKQKMDAQFSELLITA